MRGRHVLVTGGAGFIGSELVHQLAWGGARVTVLDNLVNGRRENLQDIPRDNVELVVGDIRDEALVNRLMRGVEVVFHLAVLGVRHSIHSPQENHEVNATATLKLLAAARSSGVGRFVYVSSSEVYGTARTAPMTEDHPPFPLTVYGGSKLAGECYTRAYFHTYGFPTVVLRPFNAFGPRCHHEGDSGEVIAKFMLRCMAGQPMIVFGDGTQTRDFTFVADTASGILAAGMSEGAVGKTINLGSGKEVTILELARIIARVVGVAPRIEHIEPRPGDVLRLIADTTQARGLLGFAPNVSLEDGLTRLHAWYRDAGVAPETLLQRDVVRNWVGHG
ncbi:MAG: SDR family NAD(P)-dependent oxidoreductase [Myxococcota bacterium]